jgi:AcrR family transcriptional regulator
MPNARLDRAEREYRIVSAARIIAEREGWDAVTIRRLASEIEYSQPVLYSHFEHRDAIRQDWNETGTKDRFRSAFSSHNAVLRRCCPRDRDFLGSSSWACRARTFRPN